MPGEGSMCTSLQEELFSGRPDLHGADLCPFCKHVIYRHTTRRPSTPPLPPPSARVLKRLRQRQKKMEVASALPQSRLENPESMAVATRCVSASMCVLPECPCALARMQIPSSRLVVDLPRTRTADHDDRKQVMREH
jgi:hypothetical protein